MSDNSGKDLLGQNVAMDWESGGTNEQKVASDLGETGATEKDNSSQSAASNPMSVGKAGGAQPPQAAISREEASKATCGEAANPSSISSEDREQTDKIPMSNEPQGEEESDDSLYEVIVSDVLPVATDSGSTVNRKETVTTKETPEKKIEITDPSLSNKGELPVVEKQFFTTKDLPEACLIGEVKGDSSLESAIDIDTEGHASASGNKTDQDSGIMLTKDMKKLRVNKNKFKLDDIKPSGSQKGKDKSGKVREKGKKRKNQQRNLTKRLYDEKGLLIETGQDLCDCLDQDCPGCFFPCSKCRSCKCGHMCRNDRTCQYDDIEIEGTGITTKRKN